MSIKDDAELGPGGRVNFSLLEAPDLISSRREGKGEKGKREKEARGGEIIPKLSFYACGVIKTSKQDCVEYWQKFVSTRKNLAKVKKAAKERGLYLGGGGRRIASPRSNWCTFGDPV